MGMSKQKPLPTFATARLEQLPENRVAINMQLEQLDREHARATKPSKRRAIEARMAELRRQLVIEDEDEEEKALAREMWPHMTRLELELRKLARTDPAVAAAALKYDQFVVDTLKKPPK